MGYDSQPLVNAEVKVDLTAYISEGFGTCDCVMIGGDTLDITDYKHGKGVSVSAVGNSQMRLYALGALTKYEPFYGGIIKQVRITIIQPRVSDEPSSETMTVEELKAWGETVKPLAQKAFSGFGEFIPGEHCRFCRGSAQCRARANANSALEDFKNIALPTAANKEAAPQTNPMLTHAEIGDLLTRGKGLVAWYKSLDEFAKNVMLANEEIPGWKVVAGRSNRAFTDHEAAIATAISAGYDEALLYERKAKPLTEVEKLMGKDDFKEKMNKFVHKPPGKPTTAPASDKREPYNSAKADFTGVVTPGEQPPSGEEVKA